MRTQRTPVHRGALTNQCWRSACLIALAAYNFTYSIIIKTNVMKKMILYVTCVLLVCSVAAAPDSKLIERFNNTFPNSKDVKWREDKDGYVVSFTRNETFNKAFYNKAGDFVYSL